MTAAVFSAQQLAALTRAGVELVRAVQAEGKATLYFRAHRPEVWAPLVRTFLLLAADAGEGADALWAADLSKVYFVRAGDVVYLWRVVLTKEVTSAIDAFGQAAIVGIQSVTQELDSYPLVGVAHYEVDPARGKLKGGHDVAAATTLRAAALR